MAGLCPDRIEEREVVSLRTVECRIVRKSTRVEVQNLYSHRCALPLTVVDCLLSFWQSGL